MWDVSVASVMKLIEPGRAIGDVTEPAIGFSKLGLLLFYYKLFAVNDLTRIGSLVGMAVVVPLYTALFFVFVFMDEASAWKANKAMAVFNIVTDFYLLVLPLTAVVWLRMERRKKIGLIVIFSSGFLYVISPYQGTIEPLTDKPKKRLHPQHRRRSLPLPRRRRPRLHLGPFQRLPSQVSPPYLSFLSHLI